MQGNHVLTAVGTALVLGIGVWIGATVIGDAEPERTDPDPAPIVAEGPVRAPEPPAPMLGADEATSLKRRVAALEAEVESLRAELQKTNERAGPALELFETLKEQGLLGSGGEVPFHGGIPKDIEVMGPDGPMGEALRIAAKLGLDPARQQAFVDAAKGILDEVEVLEKQHAEVTVDGDLTTITIGRYPADASRLRRDWDDWIGANLTPDERTKYERDSTRAVLFGNRLGEFDRTIKIETVGGSLQVSEHAKSPDGNETEIQSSGPVEARDFMLDGYAHLLK